MVGVYLIPEIRPPVLSEEHRTPDLLVSLLAGLYVKA